ncbi:MAG: gamma carbonic anhydrase family protein [Pseudomonadota bacterium]
MATIGKQVVLDAPAFIHPSAQLYGKIRIGEAASIFANVVMRSETFEIVIGERTNVQEFAMIHVGDFTPTIIGDDCSITTRSTLRGCTIGDRCLIGINATIMDGAEIGENSIVAGHAMVDKNAKFEANSIIAGVPAKKISERDNSSVTVLNSAIYQAISQNYARGKERLSDEQLAQIMAKAQKLQERDQNGTRTVTNQ